MSPNGISVLTPTQGRPDALLAKADALLCQTLDRDSFEWIVSFDGPDPETERRVRRVVGDSIHLVTVVAHAAGPGPARDRAAERARYDVLYLSDDDCLPGPATLAQHLAAHSDPAIWIGDVRFVWDGGERVRALSTPRWWNVAGANTSIPRRAFERVGGFGSDLRGYGGEDLWLGWRLHLEGYRFHRLPAAGVVHLGPEPERVVTVERAREAGANAGRMALQDPRVSWRLGVHPALLRAKLAVLPLLSSVGVEQVRAGLEYARGAWDVIKDRARPEGFEEEVA